MRQKKIGPAGMRLSWIQNSGSETYTHVNNEALERRQMVSVRVAGRLIPSSPPRPPRDYSCASMLPRLCLPTGYFPRTLLYGSHEPDASSQLFLQAPASFPLEGPCHLESASSCIRFW